MRLFRPDSGRARYVIPESLFRRNEPMTEKMRLELPSDAYSHEAIMNAAYDYTEKAVIRIDSITAEKISVTIKFKDIEGFPLSELIDQFTASVLDHQVRININRDTQKIREMIIAQAFEPCDNLEEIVTAVKP
jgi:His-Xaa-Ser system protein HxsD